MNHADIKGLNLMEGWEILNTFLKLDYPCMDSRNYFEHLLIYKIRCVMVCIKKASDGNNVSGIQGAQTVWQADIKTLRTKNF